MSFFPVHDPDPCLDLDLGLGLDPDPDLYLDRDPDLVLVLFPARAPDVLALVRVLRSIATC